MAKATLALANRMAIPMAATKPVVAQKATNANQERSCCSTNPPREPYPAIAIGGGVELTSFSLLANGLPVGELAAIFLNRIIGAQLKQVTLEAANRELMLTWK